MWWMNFPVELPPHYLGKATRLKIDPLDIVERFIRGGGAGGQKINKTASAVFLRHLSTGTEVKCQKHREQYRNRLSAYKILIDKIEGKVLGRESEKSQKIFKLKKQKARRSKKAKEKVLHGKKLRSAVKRVRSGQVDF